MDKTLEELNAEEKELKKSLDKVSRQIREIYFEKQEELANNLVGKYLKEIKQDGTVIYYKILKVCKNKDNYCYLEFDEIVVFCAKEGDNSSSTKYQIKISSENHQGAGYFTDKRFRNIVEITKDEYDSVYLGFFTQFMWLREVKNGRDY